jgi:hypothetical protein
MFKLTVIECSNLENFRAEIKEKNDDLLKETEKIKIKY